VARKRANGKFRRVFLDLHINNITVDAAEYFLHLEFSLDFIWDHSFV